MSWPVIVTRATLPESAHDMNSLKLTACSCGLEFVEKFQIRTPSTTSTTQNTRLFSVEFKQSLPIA